MQTTIKVGKLLYFKFKDSMTKRVSEFKIKCLENRD